MSTEIAITPVSDAQHAIDLVKSLLGIVTTLRHDVFMEGVDYGTIPGTNDKPVLLLPGMEKLLRALRLRPEYHAMSIVEDFDKPLFMYRYECRLFEIESGLCVSTAIGSANSYEQKWRWRNAKRVCPVCGKPAIIRGRDEYGGGWICFKKQDGCGARFNDGDPAIEGQAVGRVVNDDIFDQINTMDKIAQKRAMSSAIKGAANVSQFFTVDLDDSLIIDAPVIQVVDAVTGEIVPPADKPERAQLVETAKSNLGPAKPARPTIAPPPDFTPRAEAPADADLTDRDAATAFVKHWYAKGLDNNNILAALQVERIREWTEGRAKADAAISAYIDAQTALPEGAKTDFSTPREYGSDYTEELLSAG